MFLAQLLDSLDFQFFYNRLIFFSFGGKFFFAAKHQTSAVIGAVLSPLCSKVRRVMFACLSNGWPKVCVLRFDCSSEKRLRARIMPVCVLLNHKIELLEVE